MAKLLPVCMLLLPALAASSSPWGVQNILQTHIPSSDLLPQVLSPEGDIYLAGTEAGQAAPISKENAAGNLVFSVLIPGETDLDAILLGPDGNLYVTGYATSGGFVTTSGVYEASGTGPFLCRLSGADGHVLFCTFIDVTFPEIHGFAVDQAGNTYLAGGNCLGGGGCVEKLNPTGGLIYRLAIQGGYIAASAPDAGGDMFVAGWGYNQTSSSFLLKLGPTGQQLGVVTDDANNFTWLEIDSAGNPQILMSSINDITAVRMRRYKADLSATIFDTALGSFGPLAMLLDSSGGTLFFGGTDSAGVAQVHPTAACAVQSTPEAYGSLPTNTHDVMVRLDSTGQLLQSTFVASLPPLRFSGIVQTDTATILFDDASTGNIAIATLGPVPEIQLGCIANASSFRIGALSPEEIISLTGSNMGLGEPVTGQPGADNRFPVQLGATQVTFDGVAVPLLYVSSTQINAVTPLALTADSTRVCVIVNGAPTNCMDVPVVAADPGIFMIGSHAAALNQDGTINSEANPAAPGSIVSIFATGLGAMKPAPPDGSLVGFPLPSLSLQVQASSPVASIFSNIIRFDPLPSYYAGPAPYEVEGMTQINTQASGNVCVAANSDSFIARTAICPPIWIAGGQ